MHRVTIIYETESKAEADFIAEVAMRPTYPVLPVPTVEIVDTDDEIRQKQMAEDWAREQQWEKIQPSDLLVDD